ncbi:hypothetical protein DFJ77DRAFT_473810 [Powellomyces hirtus]|nr:hypothetical protein DFJ77DRAFT_473810 [Powellomyces hirtus]
MSDPSIPNELIKSAPSGAEQKRSHHHSESCRIDSVDVPLPPPYQQREREPLSLKCHQPPQHSINRTASLDSDTRLKLHPELLMISAEAFRIPSSSIHVIIFTTILYAIVIISLALTSFAIATQTQMYDGHATVTKAAIFICLFTLLIRILISAVLRLLRPCGVGTPMVDWIAGACHDNGKCCQCCISRLLAFALETYCSVYCLCWVGAARLSGRFDGWAEYQGNAHVISGINIV